MTTDRIKPITIEQLDKILTHDGIVVRKYSVRDESFERGREVLIDGTMYWIEWYCNECYLYTNKNIFTGKSRGLRINFTRLHVSFVPSLIFHDEHGKFTSELRIK